MGGGRGGAGHGAQVERREDGVGIDDGTRVGHGDEAVYGEGTGRRHGVRGDGLGVGYGGEVPDGARGRRDATCGDDGGGGEGQREWRMVGGPGRTQLGQTRESCDDGVLIPHDIRECNGYFTEHLTSTSWELGMRDDNMVFRNLC